MESTISVRIWFKYFNCYLDVKKNDFAPKYQTIQGNMLGIGLVCRRFYLITVTYPELWSTLESSVEFSVESFKLIMTHAGVLKF